MIISSRPISARCVAAMLAALFTTAIIWLPFDNRAVAASDSARPEKYSTTQIARGRDLIHLGGCDHCHTPGFAEREGRVEDSQRLIGDRLGWQGPWGTTYAANLRQLAYRITAEEWLTIARKQTRPPMPWYTLRARRDEDLIAMYAYIRSLGPSDAPVPAYVPPGQRAQTPVVRFPDRE